MKIAKDKRQHFIACYVIAAFVSLQIAMLTQNVIASMLAGFYAAFFAGIAKEYADSLNESNSFDIHDLIADMLGGAFGCLCGGSLAALL
jgi:uncharacterized protein YfiM (DUF2279 family)